MFQIHGTEGQSRGLGKIQVPFSWIFTESKILNLSFGLHLGTLRAVSLDLLNFGHQNLRI
ncbi:hypothetical protein CLV31_109167 [Algoriphagus aquaeductus]|uniref:Uncharacterized protein n=2 Tax=Algoriphagus aquaeductus TaxID=475299 RepID=A0A326RQI9_9BACT|nr:hypothetical protein CLV31_109167 [Algoriphagus aquaeductus]